MLVILKNVKGISLSTNVDDNVNKNVNDNQPLLFFCWEDYILEK